MKYIIVDRRTKKVYCGKTTAGSRFLRWGEGLEFKTFDTYDEAVAEIDIISENEPAYLECLGISTYPWEDD